MLAQAILTEAILTQAILTQAMLTIVFDLDGTLIDTAPDLISTLNFILAREGLPPVVYDDARQMIGGGARGMIERALTAEGRDSSRPDSSQSSTGCLPLYRTLCRAYRRSFAPFSGARGGAGSPRR